MDAESSPEGLIIDVDGVVLNKKELIPGSDNAIRALQSMGLPFVFATNNSRMTPVQQVDRFRGFGIEGVSSEQFVTSSEVTAARLAALQSQSGRRLRAYVIGEDGVYAALEGAGIEIARDGWTNDRWEQGKEPTHVVVGYKPDFVLKKDGDPAVSAILDLDPAAEFYATNGDATYRTQSGTRAPANGFVLGGIQYTTGVSPTIMGKPNVPMTAEAVRRLGVHPNRIAVIGDNMHEDLQSPVIYNREHGTRMRAYAVLSGVVQQQDIADTAPVHGVFNDLLSYVTALKK